MKASKCFTSAAALAAVLGMAGGAFAQDTVSVRFKVNADAVVTAIQSGDTVSIEAVKDETKALRLPLKINVPISVRYTGAAQGTLNAPAVTGSRGNITLRLPAQAYRNAEVALYTVNGKRILRGKADAAQAANSVSRKNIAAGVYMLSVKGADGGAFTSRLTHSGGNMNINVAYGAELVYLGASQSVTRSPARQLVKKAADDDWDWKWKITVAAVEEDEYYDSTYTIDIQDLLGFDVIPVQNITLRKIPPPPPPPPAITTFTDERDGKTYNKVTIGGQTWMAQNLNYRGADEDDPLGLCHSNRADSCAKYGRLYDWATAMDGASSSSAVPSGVQGVCPAGWHLPSDDEWTALETYVGGSSAAGKKLKSASGWGWEGNDGNGTDEYGFKALPGGGHSHGSFGGTGYMGLWWSAMENDAEFAWSRIMGDNIESVLRSNNIKTDLHSVRCVQNGAPPTGKKFTVAFNPDGGTPAEIASVTVDSGTAIGAAKLPSAPTKAEYIVVMLEISLSIIL